eukprot:TRINITY_DN14493_c0_g1_i1.p1 TRINITY_DN14493_c0_g1~~TRINITY_DN14493_c0_g1_i1.p1  ORF type:complete len:449 (+),score=89.59 TRINITY_DN14493_c0_g1_i1:130-1476(+)
MAKKILGKLMNQVPVNDTVAQLIRNSDKFDAGNPFPIESVRVKRLISRFPEKRSEIAHNAESAYPLVHEDVLELMVDFLDFKRKNGSQIEKSIYKDMTIPEFVNRLISKRPLVFLGNSDNYVLRGHRGTMKVGGFESIGIDNEEKPPLVMKEYLSYDEIKISALLGTSSHTLAINKGNRQNEGREESKLKNFVNRGVIVGLVGARFERKGRMERQEIIISDVPEGSNKLSPLFDKLYNLPSQSSSAKSDDSGRFLRLRGGGLFDMEAYKRRIRITGETLLLEANARASETNDMAYVHVVGLGLGVWRVHEDQIQIYADVFGEILAELKLPHVSDVDFSWIPVSTIDGHPDGEMINGIKIHISKRSLFDKLPPGDENKLLVVCWAYDGNSYPGNEFWVDQLSGSGDPQAACATQVSELHNPEINPWFNGSNLRIVSSKLNKLIKYSDYK